MKSYSLLAKTVKKASTYSVPRGYVSEREELLDPIQDR